MRVKAHSRWSAIFLVAVTILSCLPAASAAEGTEPLQSAEIRSVGVRVIPRPAKIEAGEGRFTLTAQSTILISKDTQPIGNYLAARLAPATGYPLNVAVETSDMEWAGTIGLSLSGDAGRLGDEGYEGVSTLKQLSPVERLRLAAVTPT
jgi:hypothetical protein